MLATDTRTRRRRPDLARAAIHGLFAVVCLASLTPVLVMLSASFSSETTIFVQGFWILPRDFTLEAYRFLFRAPEIIVRAYGVTTAVTTIGTVGGLLMMALLAYPLSRPRFRFRGIVSFIVFFTMLFGGGMVPFYLLMTRYLRLQNTLGALILPGMVSAYWILILRTYFAGLSDELLESARIDGAGEWRIFWQFVLPLSTPALATAGLFLALGFWNDYFQALLFITERNLWPLQYLLNEMLANANALQEASMAGITGTEMAPTETMRMAMAVIAAGPITLAFLFVNRYLVSGLTIGALK